MNMKKIAIIGLGALLLASVSTQAQIVSTNAPSFVTSFTDYATQINTNYNYDNVTFDVETGYKQATGTGSASFAKFGYYATPKIQLNAEIGYFGIGSPINSFEAGIGYAVYQNYDLRVTAEINGGWDANERAGLVDPGLELKKKLSPNTYASLGMYLPYFVGKAFNTSPTFKTGVGCTLPEGVIK